MYSRAYRIGGHFIVVKSMRPNEGRSNKFTGFLILQNNPFFRRQAYIFCTWLFNSNKIARMMYEKCYCFRSHINHIFSDRIWSCMGLRYGMLTHSRHCLWRWTTKEGRETNKCCFCSVCSLMLSIYFSGKCYSTLCLSILLICFIIVSS